MPPPRMNASTQFAGAVIDGVVPGYGVGPGPSANALTAVIPENAKSAPIVSSILTNFDFVSIILLLCV
jgi:hypothetical protein